MHGVENQSLQLSLCKHFHALKIKQLEGLSNDTSLDLNHDMTETASWLCESYSSTTVCTVHAKFMRERERYATICPFGQRGL